MALVLASIMVVGVSAQGVSKCSGDEAHLKGFELSISPDPPIPGQKTTIEFSGTLDKVVQAGTVNLNIQAGPIKIGGESPFALNPGIPTKEFKFRIGPFTYPNVPVPFIKTVTAHVEIKDEQREMVACFALNLPTSSLASSSPGPLDSKADVARPATCGTKSSDHFRNANVTTDSAVPKTGHQVTAYFAGDLDESVTAGMITTTINLAIAQVSLDIPFSVSPAFTAQHYALSVGPFKLPWIPLISSIRGNVKAVDEKNEELFCGDFNAPLSALSSETDSLFRYCAGNPCRNDGDCCPDTPRCGRTNFGLTCKHLAENTTLLV